MNRTTKGSLAALAAATLLLGGVGSLAYWHDDATVPGASVRTGTLDLGEPDCGPGWVLDGGQQYAGQPLVPGDTLTQVCAIDLTASGAHLGADLGISKAQWLSATGEALVQELHPSASFTVNGEPTGHITSEDDRGEAPEIRAVVTVDFAGDQATDLSQDLTGLLSDVVITASQTHDGADLP